MGTGSLGRETGLVVFGPGETIVGDGYDRVMSVTETGIAKDDVADIVDAEIAEVAGVAELAADGLNSPRWRFDPKGVGVKSEQQMSTALLLWRRLI